MSEIRSHDRRTRLSSFPPQRERHVAGSAAEIQNTRFRPPENGGECPRRPPPQEAIDVKGQDVIEQIIARRNGRKHLLHGPRRRRRVLRPFRRRSNHPLHVLLTLSEMAKANRLTGNPVPIHVTRIKPNSRSAFGFCSL